MTCLYCMSGPTTYVRLDLAAVVPDCADLIRNLKLISSGHSIGLGRDWQVQQIDAAISALASAHKAPANAGDARKLDPNDEADVVAATKCVMEAPEVDREFLRELFGEEAAEANEADVERLRAELQKRTEQFRREGWLNDLLNADNARLRAALSSVRETLAQWRDRARSENERFYQSEIDDIDAALSYLKPAEIGAMEKSNDR